MTTALPTGFDVDRFDFGDTPNQRGTRVYADRFPNVYVADDGTVEIGGHGYGFVMSADEALAWLHAVADHIEARRDAS